MRRALLVVGVLAALQGGAWLAWRALDRPPESHFVTTPESPFVTTPESPFVTTPASGEAPTVAPRDGLLHVWATWCAPCRDELPGLLAAARDAGVPLVAVSVDENPASVQAFFDGAVPAEVARDPGIAAALGVRDLPVTFRVEGGRLVERVDGARAWGSAGGRGWLGRAAP